jgi:hypothetical protein
MCVMDAQAARAEPLARSLVDMDWHRAKVLHDVHDLAQVMDHLRCVVVTDDAFAGVELSVCFPVRCFWACVLTFIM